MARKKRFKKISKCNQLCSMALRTLWIPVLAGIVLSSLAASEETDTFDSPEKGSSKPNIVFILIDDLGKEVLGTYGEAIYETPRIDELAQNSLVFHHAHSMPMCYPTRATLMSGKYPITIGAKEWGQFPETFDKEKTLGRTMQKAGYATAIAGKWQLELLQDNPKHPHEMGFDEYLVFGWHEGPRYWNPLIWNNGKKSRRTGEYGPDIYLNFLIDFIRENSEREQPFFAFYSMNLVHNVGDDWDLPSWTPSVPPPYGPKGRYETFEEMLSEADQKIGQLVWAIDELGIREKTVIILTSDNGTEKSQTVAYRKGEFVTRSIKGGDGGKRELTDAGVNVPMMVSWKGTTPTGETEALIDFSDFLPTFANLAGADISESFYDGKNFAEVIRGEGNEARRWVYSEASSFESNTSRERFVRTHDWKLYNTGEFINMVTDPNEKKPVSIDELSPEEKETYQMLKKELNRIKK